MLSQRLFLKRQLPKVVFVSSNFLKRQLPKSVQAAAISFIAHLGSFQLGNCHLGSHPRKKHHK